MKPTVIIILITMSLISCAGIEKEQMSKEDVIAEFKEDFNNFYEIYANADPAFIDYYTDDVITMNTNGEITVGNETYREIWVENFKNYEIDLLEYTDPGIVYSEDQIVSYNDYDELFISKETGDTRRVQGTWIGVWQKQGDKWMVKMNTFHLKLEDSE